MARWVNYIRTACKKGKLSDQRRESLEELGLNLQFEDRHAYWDARYSELVQYKQEHGDCHVSQKYSKMPKLGPWVSNQRTAYKNGTISEQNYAKLNDLGFRFTSGHESKWNDRYEQLIEFKKKYGHCNVPREPHEYEDAPDLGKWVAHQRYQHRTRKLKDERFEKLHAIDFQWDVPELDSTEALTLSPGSGRDNDNFSEQATTIVHRDNSRTVTVGCTEVRVDLQRGSQYCRQCYTHAPKYNEEGVKMSAIMKKKVCNRTRLGCPSCDEHVCDKCWESGYWRHQQDH